MVIFRIDSLPRVTRVNLPTAVIGIAPGPTPEILSARYHGTVLPLMMTVNELARMARVSVTQAL
jgi:hypothetical protein